MERYITPNFGTTAGKLPDWAVYVCVCVCVCVCITSDWQQNHGKGEKLGCTPIGFIGAQRLLILPWVHLNPERQ